MKPTKHNYLCSMAFGRYSKHQDCPRCEELKAGAAPRSGWQSTYFDAKKRADEAFMHGLRAHNCKASRCGSICTFGDW